MLDFFNENLTINSNIIRVCQERRIKKATFMLSTCVFPHNVKYPVDETMLHLGEPHHTNYGYAYAKRMLEVGARTLRQSRGIQARCIIPCNIYGSNDNYNLENGHVIPSLIHKMHIAKETGSKMVVWGSGKAEREFIYAPDAARIITMIHHDPRDIPNLMIVSPSQAQSIRDIVEIIAEAFDYTGEIVFDTSKPEGILRKPTRNDLFRKHYPDFEFTDIRKGIQETCNFVRHNYARLRT
jgi:GDP-L-fucose synthase